MMSGDNLRATSGRVSFKQRVFKIVVLFALLAAAGFIFAASGITPLKASSGHWAITRWFLHFSMRRSVSTHTLGIEIPSLNEPWLVSKGASHYDIGCSPCHGSPSLSLPRIAQKMTPHPPYLPSVISQWGADELFYIVKHGVKFTGMPAWPAQTRDDEVWAVVAFLRRLHKMDEQEYKQLVSDDIGTLPQPENAPRAVTESCARCHGVDGLGRRAGAFPRLAGQKPAYLAASLEAFAQANRHSGIMEPISAKLNQQEIIELAHYYGNIKALSVSSSPQDRSAIERGKVIALQGIPRQRVPPCAACHGPSARIKNPFYPLLAGQYPDYLLLQLRLFKKEQRGGTAYAPLMRRVADQLTAEQIRDVALYYASLPPDSLIQNAR